MTKSFYMTANFRQLGKDISKYVNDETFVEKKSSQEICRTLDYATLSTKDFSTLFSNLSYNHRETDLLQMLRHTKLQNISSPNDAQDILRTISNIFNIDILDNLSKYILSQQKLQVKRDQIDQNLLQNQMCIYVKTLTGKHITIQIPRDASTLDLKYAVQASQGIPPDQQTLIFASHQLDDRKKLSDYNVMENSTIHLILRLRGGKPVIYLYPKEKTEISVNICLKNGEFAFVYPSFDKDNTWNVIADETGNIIHKGKNLRYLFWETDFYPSLNLRQGFIVRKDDFISFFESKLSQLGLNSSEISEFIVYWIPKLQVYDLVQISFQFEEFQDICPLTITPQPDTLIRVFFAAVPLTSIADIEEQELPTLSRKGFTVVEWGGTIYK